MTLARPTALRLALLLGALCICLGGCADDEIDPVTYTADQKEAVAAATRAVRQYEDWASRAEYKLKKHPNGWQVTAWRVEHPEAKGNARYLPWGYRVIVVDRRGTVAEYRSSR